MQYDTCKNCAYWFRYSAGGTGECRRHAPAPMYSMTNDKPGPIWWPQTRDSFWCGDFKERADRVVETPSLSIDELELNTRTYNCLVSDNILTIDDLVRCTERQLRHIPNFGRRSLADVKRALKNLGLHLSSVPEQMGAVIPYECLDPE